MKISAKLRYAVRTLVELGRQPGGVISLAEVERRQQISAKFAKQILQPLEEKNLVGSKRGAAGGYFLLQPPKEISLLDVMQALGENPKLVPCLASSYVCSREKTCGARGVWEDLGNRIEEYFTATTIQDIITLEDDGKSGSWGEGPLRGSSG